MKSIFALSFLIILSGCGDQARSRSLNSQTSNSSEANKVEQTETTTEKCSEKAAIKKTYLQVMKLAKIDKSKEIQKIFADTSLKSYSFGKTIKADGTETPTMMTLSFWVEFKSTNSLYVAQTNLDTCQVLSVKGTPAMEVSEEGEEL